MNSPNQLTLRTKDTYAIFKIPFNDEFIEFIVDMEDADKVLNPQKYIDVKGIKLSNGWHYKSNAYIGKTVYLDGKQKELYLHNLIMNKLTFEGKGQKESVDHINRIGLDNRKENLRIITQSQQNKNQKKRKRRGRIVERCEKFGIDPDIIPTGVEYVYEKLSFTEKFSLNLKVDGKRLPRKVLSKKCCPCNQFPQKVQQAIENFEKFKTENPQYFIDNKEEYEKQVKKFNELMS